MTQVMRHYLANWLSLASLKDAAWINSMNESSVKPSEQLARTLAAGSPLIYVVTWEEERLESLVAGGLDDVSPPSPPPDSWAGEPDAEVPRVVARRPDPLVSPEQSGCATSTPSVG